MGLLGTGGSRSRDEGFSTGPYPEVCFAGLKERLLGTSQSDMVASLSTCSCQFSGFGQGFFLMIRRLLGTSVRQGGVLHHSPNQGTHRPGTAAFPVKRCRVGGWQAVAQALRLTRWNR